MNHRTELGLKYVIWGQRIWDIRKDRVKPWAQWEQMEDRGGITENHWFVSLAPCLWRACPPSSPSNSGCCLTQPYVIGTMCMWVTCSDIIGAMYEYDGSRWRGVWFFSPRIEMEDAYVCFWGGFDILLLSLFFSVLYKYFTYLSTFMAPDCRVSFLCSFLFLYVFLLCFPKLYSISWGNSAEHITYIHTHTRYEKHISMTEPPTFRVVDL